MSFAAKKKILAVEDEKDIQELLVFNLESDHLEIKTANSGNEALSILENESFDLIISDIKMPNGSGIELLETLKGNGSNTPFIFLTAYLDADEKQLMELGAAKIFFKPARFLEIEKAISKLLNIEF